MRQIRKYKALFIIPINTERKLTDDGWEFKTKNSIPDNVKDLILSRFPNISNSEDDCDTYRQEELIVDFCYTDDSFLESVYVRDYSVDLTYVAAFKELTNDLKKIDVFAP
ncbi:hypothetical protein [Thalassomonas haliotis]|uniref:Uncharacterized protein n=1 Tax=Thalassomonas haliotis TaxID=485448 RepID=A0ABY7VA77_9GAMM|nr:hypothetical protein [Thalassomonas haliotis]WDE10483.1 hypothetical protein H3N35_19780 [Thalassomonas haliotis]